MVVRVPVGTRVAEVLQFAGGPTIDEYRVVDGGPMMGRVLPDTDQPVTKTTSGLLVLPPDHNVVCRKVMIITSVWGGAFTCNVLLAWLKMKEFFFSELTYELISYTLLMGVAVFTQWYPAYLRQLRASQQTAA